MRLVAVEGIAARILTAARLAARNVNAACAALTSFIIFTFTCRTIYRNICASAAICAAVRHRFSAALLETGAARLIFCAGSVAFHPDISLTAEFILVVDTCLCCAN